MSAENTMALQDTYLLVEQLIAGFESLQQEYQKLFGQHQALERKLATAREQYNELVKICGSERVSTPPLSLVSLPAEKQRSTTNLTTLEILQQNQDNISTDAVAKVKGAHEAAVALRDRFSANTSKVASAGVRIWSGPSADKAEISSSQMPSISESPLEQDFTIEGKPSSLGCPFASMAKKKLSSHAASVLSRYNQASAAARSSTGGSVCKINGRDSFTKRSAHRLSFADPIKAEICGMSDHETGGHSSAAVEESSGAVKSGPEIKVGDVENSEGPVCPIRFLDQHSPEEVATYFERHKHELPRSHEDCLLRRSNEDQIRELDSKYTNLVSMIQGLGAKHKDMLPEEPEGEAGNDNAIDDAKMRLWANSVSPVPPDENEHDDSEDRMSHFERPLRDIRVGESPSRPWGITVPAKYFEQPHSATSSRAVSPIRRDSVAVGQKIQPTSSHAPAKAETSKPKGCPFHFDKVEESLEHPVTAERDDGTKMEPAIPEAAAMPPHNSASPVAQAATQNATNYPQSKPKPQMLFTGPVFVGYSAEDAAQILRASGLGSIS